MVADAHSSPENEERHRPKKGRPQAIQVTFLWVWTKSDTISNPHDMRMGQKMELIFPAGITR